MEARGSHPAIRRNHVVKPIVSQRHILTLLRATDLACEPPRGLERLK